MTKGQFRKQFQFNTGLWMGMLGVFYVTGRYGWEENAWQTWVSLIAWAVFFTVLDILRTRVEGER